MNLGFYYHIPVFSDGLSIRIPSFLGVFIDELANNVDYLYLFLHQSEIIDDKYFDYELKSNNLVFIDLGLKTAAWHRFLFPSLTLKLIKEEISNCDFLIVRSPSPLSPSFYKYFSQSTKIIYLIVGDYVQGSKYLNQNIIRKIAIRVLSFRNDYQLSKVLKKTTTIVNSIELFNKYKSFVKSLYQIKTTTISENDFFFREDTCLNNKINILYTGRFDLAKGMLEILESIAILNEKKIEIIVNFVGWEDNFEKKTQNFLLRKAKELGVENLVIFHGKKSIGEELNMFYRNADIYLIPSYHEGFPRTIWEAMANCLPVIATDVGSIPFYLTNKENVILIKPKSSVEISNAVEILISNQNLRKKIIKNAFELSKENTLESQTKKIFNIIRKSN